MSTKSKYLRVRAAQEKHQNKPDTDILMRFSDRYGKYVSRALTLFFGEDKKFVTIKAAERLIDKALWVAEVIRRKVPDLHQIININERVTIDVYQPLEEGLIEVKDERIITVVEITLTREPTAAEKAAPGYHPPLSAAEESFLTKDSWAKGEQERKQRREQYPRREDRQERGTERIRGGHRE